MEILLDGVRAQQTSLAKAVSVGRLLARRALPTHLADARCGTAVPRIRTCCCCRDRLLLKYVAMVALTQAEIRVHA